MTSPLRVPSQLRWLTFAIAACLACTGLFASSAFAASAPQTINLPLNRLPDEFEKLDPSLPTYVICQGGYRSSLGTSILENTGFENLYNVTGGTGAWIKAGLDTETSATAGAAT